jgi:hypothetical protein
MNEIKVEIFRVKFRKGVVKCRLDVFRGMECIPKLHCDALTTKTGVYLTWAYLGGNPNLIPRN